MFAEVFVTVLVGLVLLVGAPAAAAPLPDEEREWGWGDGFVAGVVANVILWALGALVLSLTWRWFG